MLVADWISRQSHTNKNKYEVKSFDRNDSVLAIPRAGHKTRLGNLVQLWPVLYVPIKKGIFHTYSP